jgi:hypothetical protein
MDKTLIARLLPAALICKGFIKEMNDCNYEKYLLEIVNKCDHFSEKSHGISYSAPEQESHGECDCISPDYSLDFKLIAGETLMCARNELSTSITRINDAIMVFGRPKKDKPFKATQIHVALRSFSLEELKEIRNKPIRKQGIEQDILSVLNTLEKKKNLLLFFPYEFYYENEIDCNSAIEEIISALSNDFMNALKYRFEIANQFDTYLTFIYAEYFIIAVTDKGTLSFIEKIPTKCSQTFTQLKDISEIGQL